MREFLLLLRYRWLAWRHDVHTKGPRTLSNLGLYGFLFLILQNLALSALLFFPLYGLASAEYRLLFLRLLVHGLTMAALALALVTAANAALGALYEAPYLSMALSRPVGTGAIYGAGFTEVVATCLGVTLALVVPAWVSLCLASHTSLSCLLTGLAGLAAEAIFGAALAALALSLILRLVGTVRLRRLFLVIMLVGLVGAVLFLQVLVVQAINRGWQEALVGIDQLLQRLEWLPHGLAARGILAARAGRGLEALRYLGWLWVLALAAMGISLHVGARTYQACWSNVQEAGPAKAGRDLRMRQAGRARMVLAILAKDWRIIAREPLFFANSLIFLLTIAFYTWGLRQNPNIAQSDSPLVQAVHFFVFAFLTTGWLAQAGAMAVSREGLAWWEVQAAPVTARQIIRAKLLFGASGLLLNFGLAVILMALTGLPLPGPGLGLPLIGGLILGLASAGLLADLILPDFTLRLDVRMSGAHAGGKVKIMLALVASLLVTIITGLTFLFVLYFLGGIGAALAVLLEGLCFLLLAETVGEHLLQKVLITGD